jgi:hypothetical protein
MRVELAMAVLLIGCTDPNSLQRCDPGDELLYPGCKAATNIDGGATPAIDMASERPGDLGQSQNDMTPSTGCTVLPTMTGCSTDQTCYIYGMEQSSCQPAGTEQTGIPCSAPFVCQPGDSCLQSQGQTICRKLCQGNSDCGSTSCYTVPDWKKYGACQ